ncbi:MAG: response regulator [Rhodospirillales bacterium]|nr:response regulator [Rhodospirillales bacterium]
MTDGPRTSFRILVVDDEQFSRHMVARMLSSLGTEAVTTAACGAEARAAMAADSSLSLVISDHYMPDDSGIRLLGDLRQGRLPLPHDTNFIVATASKSFALAAVALALDADSFMSKPFSKDDLARRLYNTLVAGTRSIKRAEYYRGIDVTDMLATAERLDPASRGVELAASVPMRPLGRVLPDTPLGADLRVKDGTVLLQCGTVLSRHLIARLTELGVREVPIADGARPVSAMWVK